MTGEGDVTPPTVTVEGAPADWQNTDAQASVGCSDAESGCDPTTYKLKTYTSSGSCSTNYSDYTLTSPQTISTHSWLCAAAKDLAIPANTGFSPTRVEFKVDKDKPIAGVDGAPASWQKTNQTATVTCSDSGGSGCNSASYAYQIFSSDPGTCPDIGYTTGSSTTISSHSWVCSYVEDNATNFDVSDPVEFKVDKEKPVSEITSPPADSEQSADFNITVSDTDTGGSGIDTSACYYYVFDSVEGQTRSSTLRTCNSTQNITVSPIGDCRTIGGTCTVYVYSYDNATNLSDTNFRSFQMVYSARVFSLLHVSVCCSLLCNEIYNGNTFKKESYNDVDCK